jgi:hypothetical protein
MSTPIPISRRDALRAVTGGAAAAAASLAARPPLAAGAEPATPPDAGRRAETLVAALWKSLTPVQKKIVAFPFDHPLRSKVDNNWQITEPIAEVMNRDQQALIRDIFKGIHSPEYAEAVFRATVHDTEGEGFEQGCSVALFGAPGSGKFELVLTGRHVTRRCDGDSVEGAAFGGPIFYGHQAGDRDREEPHHAGNAYWFQAVRANELYRMLDGKQRELALVRGPRSERGTDTVKLTGKRRGLPGLPVAELARDQKAHMRKVLEDLLAPFRKPDADEVMRLVEAQGLDNLHLAYFKDGDLGDDGQWDIWQIEGPSLLWFFRGSPHVHVWAHVRSPSPA